MAENIVSFERRISNSSIHNLFEKNLKLLIKIGKVHVMFFYSIQNKIYVEA